MLLWTEEAEIKWTDEKLDSSFDCTNLQVLSPGIELEYIGMHMFQTDKFTALCLTDYVQKALMILGLAVSTATAKTLICKSINIESPALEKKNKLGS